MVDVGRIAGEVKEIVGNRLSIEILTRGRGPLTISARPVARCYLSRPKTWVPMGIMEVNAAVMNRMINTSTFIG